MRRAEQEVRIQSRAQLARDPRRPVTQGRTTELTGRNQLEANPEGAPRFSEPPGNLHRRSPGYVEPHPGHPGGLDHQNQGSSEEVRRRRQDFREWHAHEGSPVELGAHTQEVKDLCVASRECRRQWNQLQQELQRCESYWEGLDDRLDEIYAPHAQIWSNATDTVVCEEDAKALEDCMMQWTTTAAEPPSMDQEGRTTAALRRHVVDTIDSGPPGRGSFTEQ
jgi:hypothetical protein